MDGVLNPTQIDKDWEIPVRYIYNPTYNQPFTFIPGEMYYLNLHGNWDDDMDGSISWLPVMYGGEEGNRGSTCCPSIKATLTIRTKTHAGWIIVFGADGPAAGMLFKRNDILFKYLRQSVHYLGSPW